MRVIQLNNTHTQGLTDLQIYMIGQIADSVNSAIEWQGMTKSQAAEVLEKLSRILRNG